MSKTGNLRDVLRIASCLAPLIFALPVVSNILLAQQPVAKSVKPQVRFDGGDVLFLGLSNTKVSSLAEPVDGYYVITLPCVTNPSKNATIYYRFAVTLPNALERDLLEDSAAGAWLRWDIVSAALVAEGLTDQRQVDRYRDKVAAITRQAPTQAKDTKLVQTIFETLHKQLLTGKYDVACTNLAQAIDTGDFNCVSATVLFHAMAQQAGFDVCGLEMRGHALSRIRFGEQMIDLETTCVNWFNLPDNERTRPPGKPSNAGYDTAWSAARRDAQSAEHRVQSHYRPELYTPSPAFDPTDLAPTLPPNDVPLHFREISDVQLIATIYYNRGVDELTAGHFGEATVANIKALHLDPHNENAWRNLMATLNNWAIARASEGDYTNAARLLDEGRAIDDSYELFRANQIHTYYHWADHVAGQRDYDKALSLLRLAEDRLPNQPNLRFLNYRIRRSLANEFFSSQDDRKAFEQFDLAAKIAPDGINVIEAEIADVTQYVRQLIGGNWHSRAIWLIDRELERHANTKPPQIATRPGLPPSQFAVQLPDAPQVSPIFGSPIVLSDDTMTTDSQIVVLPRRPDQAAKPMSPPTTSETSRYTVARPGSEPSVRPELLGQLQMLRAGAVIAWADEPIKQRDYPEAIRRLTIGEPSQNLLSAEQVQRLRQTYADWAAALRSENRHAEAQTILKLAADSPYLAK